MKRIKMSFPALVGNLNKLVQFVLAFNALYQPTNPLIQKADLQAFLADCLAALDAVGVNLAPHKLAIDEREMDYKRLGPLVTRLVNAFRASGAPANEVADAKTYHRKITGRRKSKAVKDDPNTPEDESRASHSASQMDFATRRQMFEDLIAFLAAAGFNPNEADLKNADTTAFAGLLETRNNSVDQTFPPLSNSRVARNNLLLDGETGIINRAQLIKAYVLSVYGANSQEYKQIKGLRFT